MLLTSYERLRRFLCLDDTAENRRLLRRLISSVSVQVESYLNFSFKKEEYTEYFNADNEERIEYFTKTKVNSITNVYTDHTGLYTSPAELSDPFIGLNNNSICLQSPINVGKKALKCVYNGGIAENTSLNDMVISDITGTFLQDKFVTGETSGAVGIIHSIDDTDLVVDVLYGIFEVGESLTMQSTESTTNVSGVGAVIDSVNSSLIEICPDVVEGVEYQCRYELDCARNFEQSTIKQDEVTRRETTFTHLNLTNTNLQPEVIGKISRYKRTRF